VGASCEGRRCQSSFDATGCSLRTVGLFVWQNEMEHKGLTAGCSAVGAMGITGFGI